MVYLKNVVTLALDTTLCTGCGMCVNVCPHAVFMVSSGLAAISDRDACMECGACSRNCPAGAITVRSGVGCAAGIIKGMLQGTAPTCDCGSGGSACCG